jgi:hypothetical protein
MSKQVNATAFVMVNGNKVNIDVSATTLDAIVKEMVKATRQEYGSHIKIAAKLNELLPFAWFDIDPKEVSEQAKELAPHKKAIYDGFHAASPSGKHSNPSVPFGRIRDYGRNLRAGLSPNGATYADGSPLPNNVSGEGEETGKGANPAKRSPMLRNVEELSALWKFNEKQAELPAKVQEAQAHIAAALKVLGLDVRTIK